MTLTGLGERSHLLNGNVDLDLHIRDVVQVLFYEDLRDVILVGHSYGGMVITGVADRAGERVRQLVYLDASRPRAGESLADLTSDGGAVLKERMRVVDGVELVLIPQPDPKDNCLSNYGVGDPELAEWMNNRLSPHPWKCFTQPLKLADPTAVDAIPRTHINCTYSLRARQRASLHRVLDADRVWEIDTGNDLMPHRTTGSSRDASTAGLEAR